VDTGATKWRTTGGGLTPSRALARNSAFYFASLAVPAAAALLLIPVTVRALGSARFGLLALAWVVTEGAGMFDMGLGRATVRYVADAIAQTSGRLRQIVAVSVVTQGLAGIVGGLTLFALAQFFATRVFSVPPEFVGEARGMFRVLALHIPLVLTMNALRAVLEGGQRFDLAAAVRIPGAVASVLIPAVSASLGASLSTILWILLASRVALVIATLLLLNRGLAGFSWEAPREWAQLRELLSYSGWVAVSTLLGPALATFDRFALGAIRGVAALGFYTGASETATRFLLLPVTAFAALLPALAADDALGERLRAQRVVKAARRQVAAVSLPMCLVMLVLAPQLLGAWLGPAFAAESSTALRVLSVGVFASGLAHLPLALLYGCGRPDLPAKLNLVQVAVHLPVTILLVRLWGINGAALAWTIRASQDLVLYEWARIRALGRAEPNATETKRSRNLVSLIVILSAVIVGAGAAWPWSRSAAAGLVLAALASYAYLCWRHVLVESERVTWKSVFAPAATAGT
jgi:O-antigen/teichoic acid export membrane protein